MLRNAALMVILAMSGAVVAQDQDPKIDDLIERLGHPDFETREKAQEEILKIGEPALKALEEAAKSDDAEVAQRAGELVAQIKKDAQVSKAIPGGTKVTLTFAAGTAEDAVKELGTAAGLEIRLPSALQKTPVSLEHRDAELLRVLDDLARQLGKTYRFDAKKSVVFTNDEFVDYPAAYEGPFKFKITGIKSSVENNFAERKSQVDFDIVIEHEPGVTLKEPAIKVLSATNEKGGKIAWADEADFGPVRSTSTMTINGKTIKIVTDQNGNTRVIEEGGAPADGQKISLRGITEPFVKFGSIKGEAAIVVPAESSKKVTFANPAEGDVAEAGELVATIEAVDDEYVEITVRAKEGGRISKDLINQDSIVIKSGEDVYEAEIMDDVDDLDDVEKLAKKDMRKLMKRIRRMQRQLGGTGDTQSVTFFVKVPKKARQEVASLSFSVKEIIRHKVKFEFKDVDPR